MSLTILHIEDEEEIGSWVSEFFTERGYKVIWLSLGHHALDYMEQTGTSLLWTSCFRVLTVIRSGQRMKQKFPEIPVMMSHSEDFNGR